MNQKELDTKIDLYKILYVESWKQYSHEDVLSHTKNTFFLSAHGALLAILTGITGVLFKINVYNVNGRKLLLGLFLYGLISLIISLIGLVINKFWKAVNSAHRSTMNMRWITARAIEWELNVSNVGLASLEHEWRKHRNLSKDSKKFVPFKDNPDLNNHHINPIGKLRGYNSIDGTISMIKFLWIIILLISMISFLIVGLAWTKYWYLLNNLLA